MSCNLNIFYQVNSITVVLVRNKCITYSTLKMTLNSYRNISRIFDIDTVMRIYYICTQFQSYEFRVNKIKKQSKTTHVLDKKWNNYKLRKQINLNFGRYCEYVLNLYLFQYRSITIQMYQCTNNIDVE